MSIESCQQSNALVTDALGYEQRGWSVILIGPNKRPIGRWKARQSKAATPEQLRDGFNRHRARVQGIAVVLGDVSGDLCCRDFDVKAAYDTWSANHPTIATSFPTSRTARGHHVFFACPDVKPRNLGDGELRGRGQYVVLPPSRHPSGTRYEWKIAPNGTIPVADPCEVGLLLTEKAEQVRDTRDNRECLQNTPASLASLSAGPLETRIADAIAATIPDSSGIRNKRLFAFLRALKAMPELKDGDVHMLKPFVRQWHTAALPAIGTKDWDTTWSDAVHAWSRIKYAKGEGPLEDIIEAALRADMPECAREYDRGETRNLIAICRELQQRAGEEPFRLDYRTAGDAVGLDRTTAGKMLAMLRADGVLALEELGRQRHASRWRYIADRCLAS